MSIAVILLIVTLIVTGLHGTLYVYNANIAPKIAKNKAKAQQEAKAAVLATLANLDANALKALQTANMTTVTK